MTGREMVLAWAPSAVCFIRGHRRCPVTVVGRQATRCARCHRRVFVREVVA